MNQNEVSVRLVGDEEALIDSLQNTISVVDKLSKRFDVNRKAANDSAFGLDKYQRKADRTSKSSKKLGGALTQLKGRFNALQIAATAAISAVTSGVLIAALDRYNELSQRIETATKMTKDYLATQRELLSISKRTGTALQVTAGVYQGLARVAPDLKASNKEILQLVSTVEELSVIGGTSKEGLANSLLQFTQGLSAGVFRAEEFNSLMENNGELVVRIAKGMGKTQGELRKMVINGKLLSEDVFRALLSQSEEVSKEFAGIDRSISRAFTRMKLSGTAYLSILDKSIGLTKGIATVIDDIGGFFDSDNKWSAFETMWDHVNSFTLGMSQNIEAAGVNVQALGSALNTAFTSTLEAAKLELFIVRRMIEFSLSALRDMPVNLRATIGLVVAFWDQVRINITSVVEFGIVKFGFMWDWIKLKAQQTWLAVKVGFTEIMTDILKKAGLGDLSKEFGMSELLSAAKDNKEAMKDLSDTTAEVVEQIKKKREIELRSSSAGVDAVLAQREASLGLLKIDRDRVQAIRDQADATSDVTSKVNDQKPVVEEVKRIWGLWKPDEWSASWSDAMEKWNEKVGDAVSDVILGEKTLGEATKGVLKAIAKDVISTLASIAAKRIALFVVEKIGLAATTAAAIASSILVAAAWAPAAALASLASFGSNSIPASAGIASTFALSKGIALAGQAHDGLERAPRTGTFLIEKGERVVNVRDNKKLSRALDGGSLSSGGKKVTQVNNQYDINLSIQTSDADSFAGKEGEITNLVIQALNQARAEAGEAPLI